MSKSKFVIDRLAKLFEQGLISYKDLSNEIIKILKLMGVEIKITNIIVLEKVFSFFRLKAS